MSPLTKALVVIVSVLSIGLVAVVVPFVAKTEAWKDKAQSSQAELNSARAREVAATRLLSESHANQNADGQAKDQQIAFLENELALKERELANSEGSNAVAEAELSAALARLAGIEGRLGQQTELLTTYAEDLAQAQRDLEGSETEKFELIEQLEIASAELDATQRTVRLLQEQVARLEREVTDQIAQGGGRVQSGSTSSQSDAPANLTGAITGTREQGGQVYVELNVGASDGLEAGMELGVFRGGEFVGIVVIREVRDARSVGVMERVSLDVTTGDTVLSM